MTLRFEHADEVARAAPKHARAHGLAACIAVCDGTDALGGHEAIGRAVAAAGSGGPSERAEPTPGRASTASAEGPGFSKEPRGLPLARDGGTFGGIGVCGGDKRRPVDCAQAGVDAFRRQEKGGHP